MARGPRDVRSGANLTSIMPSYWQLLLLILPVFVLIGLGAVMRHVKWLNAEADASLLKLVVSFLYPCLIFENVLGNAALRVPGNLGGPAISLTVAELGQKKGKEMPKSPRGGKGKGGKKGKGGRRESRLPSYQKESLRRRRRGCRVCVLRCALHRKRRRTTRAE